jgi:hypothetical protein
VAHIRCKPPSPLPSPAGYNINVPLPPGTGYGGYKAAWDRVVLPALRAYKPDVIFVSSGFDCCFLGQCAAHGGEGRGKGDAFLRSE